MAFLSDRAQQRGSFVGCLLLLALVGFIIAIASDKPGAKYAGIFIAASGTFIPELNIMAQVFIQPFLASFPGWRTTSQEVINAQPEWQSKCIDLGCKS
jgi:hypothetical protein